MKDFLRSLPVWVLVMTAVVVVAAVGFGLWHLAGGGMAGMH